MEILINKIEPLKEKMGNAVAVLINTPAGIPLVRDPKKPEPRYWKLPGGRSNPNEYAIQAAVREIREELGLDLEESDIKTLFQEKRKNHIFTLYETSLPDISSIKDKGNEGEEIKIFSPSEIDNLVDFFPNHKNILKDIKKF